MNNEKSISDIIQQLSQERANSNVSTDEVVLKSNTTDFSLKTRVEISSHPVLENVNSKPDSTLKILNESQKISAKE